MFDAETSVYAALQNYQGREIPRLIASITLDTAVSSTVPPPEGPVRSNSSSSLSPSTQKCARDRTNLLNIKGIILEYARDTVPESAW
jgi:hypothetical protein